MAVTKLYNWTDDGILYHEAWADDGSVTEHWGKLGTRGETKKHPLQRRRDAEDTIEQVLADARSRGFREADEDEQHVLLIEYAIEGMGSPDDLAKRHALEDRMNETLGWTGLGNCDGGSIGSGTMEVCCFVVDFEIARTVIAADLAGTEFANYSRIFDESAE